MNDLVDETPAPKRRKSVKAKHDARIRRRSSPHNNTRGPAGLSSVSHGDCDLGSSVHNRGEDETSTTSMAADVQGLLPKPGELKLVSPISTGPQPSTDTHLGGTAPIPKVARRTRKVVGPARKRTPNMSLQSRSTDIMEIPPVEGLNPATPPKASRRIRGMISPDAPRRQSARVAARNPLPSAIINSDAVGVDSSFNPEAAQDELPSNASSPLTELDSDGDA